MPNMTDDRIQSPVLPDRFGETVLSSTVVGGASREAVVCMDELTAGANLLPVGTMADSKTFRITRDPWIIKFISGPSTGQEVMRLSDTVFTIIRAPLVEGGYRCYMTLAFFLKANGWTTWYNDNPALRFGMDVRNDAGGALYYWDIGPFHVRCPYASGAHVYFQTPFNPDIYDLIGSGTEMVLSGAAWYQCNG